MPDESPAVAAIEWTRAIDAGRLQPGNPVAVKLAGKRVALFMHAGSILACNNRCPHEGYPLIEGALDGDCKLTCHWHNWKFDLRTGVNEYGGDNLRIYPVKVDNGAVWLDLRDPPADLQIARLLASIDEAIADVDAPRIARETARLAKVGASPERALAHAIVGTHAHLRYGMTHAYAGAEAWLRLRDTISGDARKLACATEALSHIGFDVRGEPLAPFATGVRDWNEREFLVSVESQDEALAVSYMNGALESGLHFTDLEPALTAAALDHYSDFGHTLIYLTHIRRLIDRLGRDVERPLLLTWLRSLAYATREDLLPDFQGYAATLAGWPAAASRVSELAAPASVRFEGKSIREALAAALDVASFAPLDIYGALFETAARQLLRFDEAHALRTDNSVADNVGWLDFSHALTFGHALREQCARLPERAAELWPQGLLQLALFIGRNKSYLSTDPDTEAELRRWSVVDAARFEARAVEAIIDHGIGLPIFPVHWLKTWLAVRDECALGLPEGAQRAGLAAVNRLLAVRFKQRHALRTAHQALGFVGKE
ncbi:MAG: Rieske (2Fe-2S) protein [Dokdonella sp.]